MLNFIGNEFLCQAEQIGLQSNNKALRMGAHLVTGGNGFVGSFIVKALLDRGERVHVIDLLPLAGLDPKVKFFRGDITNADTLAASMAGIEYVHHCAAHVPLTHAGVGFERNNTFGTKLVLEAALRIRVKHFNYISSSAVYGVGADAPEPILETAIRTPLDDYSKSKQLAEDVVFSLAKGSPLTTCAILRPRAVIGPGRVGILQILFDWILNGRPIYIIGNGKNIFQLLDVRDLAQAAVQTADRRQAGAFNLGADNYGSLLEAIDTLRVHAQSQSKIVHLPISTAKILLLVLRKLRLSPLSAWHFSSIHKNWHFDLNAAKTSLQWQPQYSNNDTLRDAYDWYVKNRTSLNGQSSLSVHRSPIHLGILNFLK